MHHQRHMHFLATMAALAVVPAAFADCDDIIDHPSKLTFGVHIYTTSSLERPDPVFRDCEKQFEELVPVEEDGFDLETFCDAESIADVLIDGQPAAYARAQGMVMMEGEPSHDGFHLVLHQVGRVEQIKGLNSIRMSHYLLYPFKVNDDVHFTFVHDTNTPEIEDAGSEVFLVNRDTGLVRDMTGFENELLENAEPIAAGAYELRILAEFDQAGADDYVEVASDRVRLQFHCKYDLIPADINHDGRVDGLDLARLLGAFNSYELDADLNDDGRVDGIDLAILLGDWNG